MKLKNSNVTKLRNTKYDKNNIIKMLQESKTQKKTKLKNLKCDKTQNTQFYKTQLLKHNKAKKM